MKRLMIATALTLTATPAMAYGDHADWGLIFMIRTVARIIFLGCGLFSLTFACLVVFFMIKGPDTSQAWENLSMEQRNQRNAQFMSFVAGQRAGVCNRLEEDGKPAQRCWQDVYDLRKK